MGCFKPKGGPDGEDDKKAKEANKRIEKLLAKDKQIYKATHRLLLLGMYELIEFSSDLSIGWWPDISPSTPKWTSLY